jgi:hypothetical protein
MVDTVAVDIVGIAYKRNYSEQDESRRDAKSAGR